MTINYLHGRCKEKIQQIQMTIISLVPNTKPDLGLIQFRMSMDHNLYILNTLIIHPVMQKSELSRDPQDSDIEHYNKIE